MRFVRYEFGKIWNYPLMLLFLVLFLVLNVPLLLWQTALEREKVQIEGPRYDTLEAEYRNMPIQEAYEKLREKEDEIAFIYQIEAAQTTNDAEFVESVVQENPELFARYRVMLQDGTVPQLDERAAIRELYRQAAYIHDYPDYIAGIREQAELMKSTSIFQNAGDFSYWNIIRTPQDFANNQNLQLSFGRSEGIVSLSNFYIMDVFVLILLLVAAVRLFWDEKEKGLLVLVKSTVNGRLKTVLAKIAALLFVAVILTGVFYGMNIVTAKILFGFGDTSRVIQSMQEFGGGNIILTVREYLVVFWLGKLGAVFVLAMLFAAAFSLFRNNAIAIMSLAGMFGASYLAYRYIPNLSPLNPLKYLNPVASLCIMDLVAKYNNINLFGYPCNRVISVFVVMGVLLVLCFIVTIRCYIRKQNRTGQIVRVQKLLETVRRLMGRWNGVGLFGHEFRKLAFSRKMIVLPILMLILCSNMLMKSEPVYSFDDDVYNRYLEQLEGELTEEKKTFLREEQERFDNVPADMARVAQQLEDGEITKNRYEYEQFLLESFQKQSIGFAKVMKQYQAICELEERGIRAGFVNEFSSGYLFDQSGRDAAESFVLLLCVVMVTAVCFCQEYRRGMIHIMNPTINGKGKLYRCKIGAVLLFVISFMMIWVPEYSNQSRYYPIGDWSLPIQNIALYQQIPLVMSIRTFVILSRSVQLMAALAVLFLTTLFAVHFQNQIVSIIVALVAGALMLILYLFGIDVAQYLPYANAFLWNESMRTAGGFAISLLNVALIMVLLGICAGASYRRFCNRPAKRRIRKRGGAERAS